MTSWILLVALTLTSLPLVAASAPVDPVDETVLVGTYAAPGCTAHPWVDEIVCTVKCIYDSPGLCDGNGLEPVELLA